MPNFVPRSTLLSIYKMFIRPHLDYGDIIYHHPNNENFQGRLDSIQHNSVFAILGAVGGTSREKLYTEIGLESLSGRRWFRRKIITNASPTYLQNLLHDAKSSYPLHISCSIRIFINRTEFFFLQFLCVFCAWME